MEGFYKKEVRNLITSINQLIKPNQLQLNYNHANSQNSYNILLLGCHESGKTSLINNFIKSFHKNITKIVPIQQNRLFSKFTLVQKIKPKIILQGSNNQWCYFQTQIYLYEINSNLQQNEYLKVLQQFMNKQSKSHIPCIESIFAKIKFDYALICNNLMSFNKKILSVLIKYCVNYKLPHRIIYNNIESFKNHFDSEYEYLQNLQKVVNSVNRFSAYFCIQNYQNKNQGSQTYQHKYYSLTLLLQTLKEIEKNRKNGAKDSQIYDINKKKYSWFC